MNLEISFKNYRLLKTSANPWRTAQPGLYLYLSSSSVYRNTFTVNLSSGKWYRGADKSLVQPEKKEVTATKL